MPKIVIVCLLFLVSFCSKLASQSPSAQDTIFDLPTIQINESFLRIAPTGSAAIVIDSVQLSLFSASNLADLLTGQGNIYIKSYGLGSLATSSLRGGNASQTLITWNDIPIFNPSLGQTDLSLIPIPFANKISIIPGGNSSIWGSGAVGGIIAINTDENFNTPLSIAASNEAGSFGWQRNAFDLTFGKPAFWIKSHFSLLSAENDFPYSISKKLPEKRQSNANLNQYAWLQEFGFRTNSKNYFKISLWKQQSEREIPPNTTQSKSLATQQDEIFRGITHWKKVTANGLFNARLAFVHEKIIYRDPLIQLNAPSRFSTWYGSFERQWSIKERHFFNVGANFSTSHAFTDGYTSGHSQSQLAGFVNYKVIFGKLEQQINLRQGFTKDINLPFVPSLGISYPIFPSLTLAGNVSRNFRLPTLNDLFWNPGGNPGLSPELGWNQSFTIKWKKYAHVLQMDATATLFRGEVRDWILWSVLPGNNFWSAVNLAHVETKGISLNLSQKIKTNVGKLTTLQSYENTHSINQKTLEFPNIRAGDQLVYTPVHQASGSLLWEWKCFNLLYRHQFTGSVLTFNDKLKGFQTGQFHLMAQPKLNFIAKKGMTISAYIHIENCWNENYRVIERQPMPGRYYRTGMKIFFIQKQN